MRDAPTRNMNISITQSVMGNNGNGIVASLTTDASGALNQFAISDTVAVNNSSVGMHIRSQRMAARLMSLMVLAMAVS